jgi:hypothetical protein
MNQNEYKAFVAKVYSGSLLIGIDRAIARKFYTDFPLSKIEEETDEAPYFEKMVVWFAFLSAPIALLVSFVLSVLAFQWWAVLIIPLPVVVYFIFSGQSSMPRRGMLGISILLAFTIAILFSRFFTSPFVPWYLIAVVFALWASRLVYCAATAMLRAFILRNQRALEFMQQHIQVKDAEQ